LSRPFSFSIAIGTRSWEAAATRCDSATGRSP
jgi:hypothetical protein